MTMNQDQLLNIDTPENVIFDYEIAGIGSRFIAAMVDSILIVMVIVVANITGLLIIAILGLDPETLGPAVITALMGLFSFLVFWGYYILFEIIWNGQSPGKRWQRLRVLQIDGTPITARDSAIRNLVRIIDFLPVFYAVGLITMFANGRDRRLGDFAAGTLVVHEESSLSLDDLKIDAGKLQTVHGDPESEVNVRAPIPVEKLTSEDIQLVEDYLLRRFELGNQKYLATQIGRSLSAKMELSSEVTEFVTAEQFLIQILLTYRKQFESSD